MPGSPLPEELLAAGAACGRLLRERGHRVAVGEGSCGGLISAALLAVPGASTYYLGGAVIYTGKALSGLVSGRVEPPDGLRGASEPWAAHLAEATRVHVDATWAIGEGGAAGPSGNRYGDPAGHAWVAVAGPRPATRHVLTGDDDRQANMVAFAVAALELLAECVAATDATDPADTGPH
ncbi:MAG: CinA family protein [Actinomycetota bacterium]